MIKRFLKSPMVAGLASFLISLYLRAVRASSSQRLTDRRYFDEALARGDGVILTFWHGRLAMTPFMKRETTARVYMLASAGRDGEIILNGVRGFGVDFIRGSAANPKKAHRQKRGASAIAQMIAALGDGQVVAITPDGPRGPRESVQAGVLKISQMSGAPIIPVGPSASRAKLFDSWDRFMLPTPFAKLHFVLGPPITVPKKIGPDEVASLSRTVQGAIRTVTADADRLAGRAPS